ncbi:MAG: carboxypeptidase regulatory-like domain-containing protein [Saprospiraceae bacterium]
MKKLLLLSIFVCSGIFALAQQTILTGVVLDSLTTPLAYANIQVFCGDSLSLCHYDVTDDKGRFRIELTETGTYEVKASYLGYNPQTKTLLLDAKRSTVQLDFNLNPQALSLYEVIVKEKAPELQINGDTVKYKLDRFTNGSEETLGQVLNKLPGIEVDENGKIKANGKKIDKLLIDGEEFFHDQHQLATQNISAEMLKDVELLQKYQEFAAITDLEESNQTALNVNIKDSYKGKITGDLAAEYGYHNRYRAHSNLFRFGRKSKLSLITDSNNTGQQAISFEDYVNFQGGIKQYMKNNGADEVLIVDEENLPSFLLSQEGVQEKQATFAALNFIYHPYKFVKFKLHSILSHTQRTQAESIRTDFFTDAGTLRSSESINGEASFLFNTTTAEVDFKPDDRSILNYTIIYNPTNDQQERKINQEILDTQKDYLENASNRNYSFGQQLSYLRRINESTLMTINTFQDLHSRKNRYQIEANRSFLELAFPNNLFELAQDKVNKKTSYGFNTKLAFKVKKSTFKIRLGGIFDRYHFNANLNDFPNTEFSNVLNLNRKTFYSGLSYNGQQSILHYTFALDYYKFHTNYNQLFQQNANNLFPKVRLELRFKTSHKISLQYSYTNSFPCLEKTIQQYIIKDFRSIQANEDVRFDHFVPANNFTLQYFIVDFLSGTTVSFNTSYSRKKNPIGITATATPELNKVAYRIVPFETAFNTYFLFDYKFSGIPFSARLNLVFNQNQQINFLAEQENQLTTNLYLGDIRLNSRFDQEWLNFTIGLKLVQYELFNQLLSTNNTLLTLNPQLNLSGQFLKSFKWQINTSYEQFETNNAASRNRLVLSPTLRYHENKSKYEFSIVTYNLLNLNTTELIQQQNEVNYVQEIIYSNLAGYLNFNIKYRF